MTRIIIMLFDCSILLPMAQQPLVGQGLFIMEASQSHSDTPRSVGLLWTSDQPDSQTSTRRTQHTHETDIHASDGARTLYPRKRAAADPRFRLRGHWDCQTLQLVTFYFKFFYFVSTRGTAMINSKSYSERTVVSQVPLIIVIKKPLNVNRTP
jgi:hypothetical protein